MSDLSLPWRIPRRAGRPLRALGGCGLPERTKPSQVPCRAPGASQRARGSNEQRRMMGPQKNLIPRRRKQIPQPPAGRHSCTQASLLQFSFVKQSFHLLKPGVAPRHRRLALSAGRARSSARRAESVEALLLGGEDRHLRHAEHARIVERADLEHARRPAAPGARVSRCVPHSPQNSRVTGLGRSLRRKALGLPFV